VTAGLERVRNSEAEEEERFTGSCTHVSTICCAVAYSGSSGKQRERIGHMGRIRARSGSRLVICMPGFIAELPAHHRSGDIRSRTAACPARHCRRWRTRSFNRPGRVLNAIYEEDFLRVSYGFPARARPALRGRAAGLASNPGGELVLDADIAGFFDSVSHDGCRFVEHRIATAAHPPDPQC